jgi:hypothetical protein
MTTKNMSEIDLMVSEIIQTYKSEKQRQFGENKQRLITALRSTPILSVRIGFDGSGDEGYVHPPEAFGDGDAPCEIPDIEIECLSYTNAETIALKLTAAVESLAEHYLEDNHGGWEFEEGAYGEFRVDVPNGAVTLEYNERFIDTTYSEVTF